MARDRTLTLRLAADPSNLEAGTKRATSAVKTWASESQDSIAAVEQSTEKMARLWRSAFEAFIGFEVINSLKNVALGAADIATNLAVAQEVAKNFGNSFDPAKMKKWGDEFLLSTAAGTTTMDDLNSEMQRFASLGLNDAQIQRAIADTANLAAARHITQAEAMQIVSMALSGHIEMLTRYGIVTREQAKNIKTTEQGMELLEQKTKGAASATQAPIEAFNRLSLATKELKDSMGTALIPVMTQLANAAEHIVVGFNKIPPPVLSVIAKIVTFTAATVALVLLLPAMWKALELVGEGMKLIGGLVTWVIPLLDLLATSFEAVAAGELSMAAGFALAALGPVLIGAAVAALIGILLLLVTDMKDTKELFVSLWNLMADEVRLAVDQFEFALKPFSGFFRLVAMECSDAWNAFCNYLHDSWKATTDTISPMFKGQMTVLTTSLGPVSTAWDKFCKFLEERFAAFAKKLGINVDQVKKELMGMTLGLVLDTAGLGPLGALLGLGAGGKQDKKTKKDAQGVAHGAAGELQHFKDVLKGTSDFLTHLFDSTAGKDAKFPKAAFGNTMGEKKDKGDKGAAEKAAEEFLKNLEDAIRGRLDDFQAIVDKAKGKLEASKTALASFDVAHPSGVAMTPADEADRAKLVTNEMNAQRAVGAALLAQSAAEQVAHDKLIEAAKEFSKHLKNHSQLIRQATDAAREHYMAAMRLNNEYQAVLLTVQQIKAAEQARKTAEIDTADKGFADQANQNLAGQKAGVDLQIEDLQQAIAMLPYGGSPGGVSWSPPPEQSGKNYKASLDEAKKTMSGGSKSPSLEEDKLKIAMAQLAEGLALDTLETKRSIAERLKETAERKDATDTEKAAAISALNEVTAAQMAYVKSVDDVRVAQAKFMSDQQQAWTQLITGLISKANAPGLGYNAGTQSVSFDPMQMLMSALEQTQMFGDVMNTVTQIVQTFAQMLNTLRPIIDALLMVIRAIVNVFIFLYNAVARIIDLMGAQVQQLQYLTDAMGGLVPLIQIWHEIPTLNELAAGRLNSPLSTVPTGNDSLGQSNGGQNMLMKIVEVLTAILVAEVIARVLAGQSLAHAVQSTVQMVGIRMNTQRSATQAPQLSQQQVTATRTAQQQVNQTMQMIGGKAQSAVTVTNNYLQQILTTLQQMVAQSSGGSSGLFGILGALVGINKGGLGAGGGGAVGFGGGPGFGAAALPGGGGAQAALQAFGDQVAVVTRALAAQDAEYTKSSSMVAKLTDNMMALATAVQSTSRSLSVDAHTEISGVTLNNGMDIADLSNALSKNTDRAIATSTKGLNRVP